MMYTINNSNAFHPLPIAVTLLGINHRQEPIQRPHGIQLYQWFYCAQGTGEFIVNGQRSIISRDQGMLIHAGIPHSYRGLTPEFRVHFFGFEGALCGDLLRSLRMPESGVFSFSDPDTFLQRLQELDDLRQKNIPHKIIAYSTLCYRFLLDLSEIITQITPSEQQIENETIRRILIYMEENYAKDISLNELASFVNLSKEYLCHLFKDVMGQTIIHYLKMLRTSRARILLHQYPEKKTLEIAAMCGFQSPSYFGKVFKSEVGITPEEYRKM